MSSPDFSGCLRDSDDWCTDVSSVGLLAFRKAVVDESLGWVLGGLYILFWK